MKRHHLLPLLLATSGCAIADAAPPVFTFSLGIRGDQSWVCNWDWNCGCMNGNHPAPWMRADCTSVGNVMKQGNVPFEIAVAFERNIIRWEMTPSTSSIVAGEGCAECCAGGIGNYQFLPLPSVTCGLPMYPPYEFYSLGGCRTDQFFGSPVMSVIAEGVPNPRDCGTTPDHILARCQSGTVRYTFCRDDFDADGEIGGADLSMILLNWGFDNIWFVQRLDLDDDGEIGASDIALLLLDWGECPTPDV